MSDRDIMDEFYEAIGEDNMYGSDFVDYGKRMAELMDIHKEAKKNEWEGKYPGIDDIWTPKKEEDEKLIQDKREQLFKEWDEMKPQDPVERLRKEMREELKEIKEAIRKIGILFDSDVPSEEILKKHKALKAAYLKYKMIEALTLGKKEEGGDDGG